MVHHDQPAALRTWPLPLALAVLLFAGAAATAGCGETSNTPVKTTAATPTTGATASSAAKTTTSTGPAHGPSAATAPDTATTSSSKSPGGRSRAHLELPPAGARPAPRLPASARATLPVTDITLSSPAITQRRGASKIATRYTCHGQNSSPALHWSGVPAGTNELALLVMNTTPVAGKLFFDWAVAGLSPALTGLHAGELPAGAVTGRNSYGHTNYNLCPPTNRNESYVFMLFALPATLSPKPGFDPAQLRTQALETSHHSGLLAGTNG